MSILRSVGAVFAGLLAVVVLSEGTDFVMRSAGIFPPLDAGMTGMTDEKLAIATVYRTIAGGIGGFVAAMLAPSRPGLHAVGLGLIGLVLGTAGAIVMWDIGHHWYPITLAVVALPASWFGGRLYEMRETRLKGVGQ
jgi:hypothetical protein